MFTLMIDRRDASLDYAGQCLIVRHPQLPTRSIPMRQLRKIVCMHAVALHTRVVGQCQRFGIDFVVLNGRSSDNSFAVHARHQQQAARRLAQYRVTVAPEHALVLSRYLVWSKLGHCARVLGSQQAVTTRDRVRALRSAVPACSDEPRLRGLEGSAQRLMFQYWRSQLPDALGFTRRQRRPPPDPVNAVLSLTYTLVHHEAIRQCLVHGLDPWLGIYHRLAHGRQSLACDLIEPLRPHVELWVVQQFCQGLLDKRHFSRVGGGCLLGKAGRELYYRQWYARQPLWGRQLRHHAGMLARHLDAMQAPPASGQPA